MNSDKKILFISDMDGTLLPSDKIVNPADIDAISHLQECGGKFSVATGRSLQSAERFFGQLSINAPAILCNGGAIYDYEKKEYAWIKYIDDSAYEIMRSIFERFDFAAGEIDLQNEIIVPRMNAMERHHIEVSGYKAYSEITLDKVSKGNWCKVLFAVEREHMDELKDYVYSQKWDKVDFVQSSKIYFEMLPKDCSKGTALQKIVEMYKYEGYTVVACGDFDNDVSMLRYADIGIAPANAQECAKNAADYVTAADCNNGAVSEAIEYILNIL